MVCEHNVSLKLNKQIPIDNVSLKLNKQIPIENMYSVIIVTE